MVRPISAHEGIGVYTPTGVKNACWAFLTSLPKVDLVLYPRQRRQKCLLGILNVITKSRLSFLFLITAPKNAKPIPHAT